MNLSELRAANIARSHFWDPEGKLDWEFFCNELAGEVGEACNLLKKLHREELGLPGSRATKEQLATELADCVICIDLCLMSLDLPAIDDSYNPRDFSDYPLSRCGRELAAAMGWAIQETEYGYFGYIYDAALAISKKIGFDLMEATRLKFNATSKKLNLPVLIGGSND